MRLCVIALLCVLVLAAPARGESTQPPTKLWAEYPLVPKIEKPKSRNAISGPFVPPVASETARTSSESTRWSLWLAIAALGLATAFVGLRTARAALGTTTRAPVPRPPRQYAPTRSPSREVTVEGTAHRSVIRSTGLVRSRFVVVEYTPTGGRSKLASSRSFWNVGSERGAEEAWDDLVNDLRTAGWEPDRPRRSEYYVVLRRIEEGSSIVPSIDAYIYEPESLDDS